MSKQKQMVIDGHGRLGMMFENKENLLRIVNIAKGSKADTDGVVIGDVITGVNGVRLPECLVDPSSTAEISAMIKISHRPLVLNFNQLSRETQPEEASAAQIDKFKELLARGLKAKIESPHGNWIGKLFMVTF